MPASRSSSDCARASTAVAAWLLFIVVAMVLDGNCFAKPGEVVVRNEGGINEDGADAIGDLIRVAESAVAAESTLLPLFRSAIAFSSS